MKLDAAQFVAIYSLLQNVKLGKDNIFEDAVTRLLKDLDQDGAEVKVNNWASRAGLDRLPDVSANFNNDDGLAIVLSE